VAGAEVVTAVVELCPDVVVVVVVDAFVAAAFDVGDGVGVL